MALSKANITLHRACLAASFAFAFPKSIKGPVGLLRLHALRPWLRLRCSRPRIIHASGPRVLLRTRGGRGCGDWRG